jgi:hypothetical protein
MPYKYVIIWFTNSKCYFSRDEKGRRLPRPRVTNVKCFRSLDKAQEFRKLWSRRRDTNLYKVLEGKG